MYSFLLSLAAVIIGTKLLGELARRFGQPSVLGELLAGVILGSGALAVLDPRDPAMRTFGELGLFVLLFQIGLHTDLSSLRRVGRSSLMVAVVGVVLPFIGGFFALLAFGVPVVAAVIGGASLTATSMAISARILGDKGVMHSKEGQIVAGAAVADDVIGLLILAIIVAFAGGTAITALGVLKVLGLSAGFIVAALAVGHYAVPSLFRVLDGIRAKGSLGMLGLAFGILLAALALATGVSMIVGAFVAGMILHRTPQRQEVERTTVQVGNFLVPIFFAVVGATIQLPALASVQVLLVGAVLIAIGIAGKVAAGYAAVDLQGNKLLVGVAMIPRGEVGLIFAQMGLATGAITPALFGSMMLMVIVTTFVSPPLAGAVIRRDEFLDPELKNSNEFRSNGGRKTEIGRRRRVVDE